jgi:RNA polymerase sigma-70 factor (ECF subfamily)
MVLSIDDPRLVESFRAGENEAFEALMRAHRPALYRHALRKLSDHAAAEDAVQETFTRAYRSRARVGDDWKLSAWLHQICANVCIDEANRRRRESTKASRWATAEVPQHTAPALEDQLGLDADHSDVVRALRELPTNYQEALELRYVAELEYDEMAEVLEISEENVRARVSRANKAIRVLLRPVAAIIAFFAAFSFRRGGKGGRALAATAESASTSTQTISTATNLATQASHTASMFAPLVETAQAVAIQAPHAMPLISKAAIGIGMVVVATSPATAPIVIDQFRDASAPVAVQSAPGEAPATLETTAAPLAVASTTLPAESASASPATTAAPGAAIVVVGDGFTAPTVAPSTAVATTVVAITRSGGQLSIAVVAAVPSGPRIDLSGSGSLQVGDKAYSGSLTGRTALSGVPDSRGRQRLDASLLFATADGPVEIRIAGFATATPAATPADGAPAPTSFAINGVFKVVSDVVPLLLSGTASGSLGSGLALTLSN